MTFARPLSSSFWHSVSLCIRQFANTKTLIDLTRLQQNLPSKKSGFRAFILYLQTFRNQWKTSHQFLISTSKQSNANGQQNRSKTHNSLIDSKCRRGFLHWQCAKGLMEEPNNSCSISFILYGTDGFKNRDPFRC